jgi:hypothetical protein
MRTINYQAIGGVRCLFKRDQSSSLRRPSPWPESHQMWLSFSQTLCLPGRIRAGPRRRTGGPKGSGTLTTAAGSGGERQLPSEFACSESPIAIAGRERPLRTGKRRPGRPTRSRHVAPGPSTQCAVGSAGGPWLAASPPTLAGHESARPPATASEAATVTGVTVTGAATVPNVTSGLNSVSWAQPPGPGGAGPEA